MVGSSRRGNTTNLTGECVVNRIDDLLAIMARLRDPQSGCPWDLAQDFATIVPHTLEEAHEVADAIERRQFDRLPDELGDLLFQVVFYARLGSERGWFDFADVVESICGKLIGRHPHVFAGEATADAGSQSRRWEAMKAEERAARGEAGVLDGIALSLPALSRAAKLQRRAARVGFDWSDVAPVYEKLAEEIGELRAASTADEREAELGDLLFVCVNLARHLDIDPEAALRRANGRFERRFRYIETGLRERGSDPSAASLEQMDQLWEEAKRAERGESTASGEKSAG